MGVDYQARQIYDMQIKDVTTSADKWKSILKLAGNLYRYEFDNILLIYAQRPQATLVADYDTWKKVDRYVCLPACWGIMAKSFFQNSEKKR